MVRCIPLLALAVASVFATPAFAEQVTVSYQGVVTRSSGAQPGPFAVGQEITVSYTVETTAADIDPNPESGVFQGGMVALRITIPAAGVDAQVGPGTVQTFDNANGGTSDQVFFYGNATGGSLLGMPLTRAEVDFIDDEAGPAGFPIMLTSDAIPTQPLATLDSFAILYTDAGYTFVNFIVEPDEPTPAEQVEEGRGLVAGLVGDGRLHAGLGSALDSKLGDILIAIEAGNTALACDTLRAFNNQVNALHRARRIDDATAAELREFAGSLAGALGC